MDPFEHDACGVGFLAELDGSPRARVLPLALTALGRMGHRGAVDADGRTGDGAGVTTQIPYVVLADFYPDLRHPAYSTAFALFHQRFSTNTDPSWALTQPFRLLAHNGEINTIQGNRIWMEAREPSPLMRAARSDSASLDEALA